MRILVTGGTGIIGRPAVDRMLKRGHTVRLLSRHADEDARRWPEGVEPFQASVGDASAIQGAADGCDVVLHIAGIVAENPPEVTFERINVEGTRLLLREAERAGVKRFVFVSSLGAERGQSDYHRSKIAAEELVRAFRGDWLILRPGNVYGPGDEVVSLILKMVRILPVVPVVGSGDQPFQPIWTEDLGEALAVAVERGEPGRVYLLAGAERTSMNDLLDRFGEITGRRPLRFPVPEFVAETGTDLAEQFGVDFPVNRDQITMLEEENVIEPPETNALTSVFGVTPLPLDQGLRLLADAGEERLPQEGVGDLHGQRFWAEIRGSRLGAAGVITLFRDEFATLTPDKVMEVGVEKGTSDRLDEGETLTMHIPLRGTIQVRVEEVTPTSVTVMTLEGHHLAGVIRFEAEDLGPGRVRFEIRSYTRAATVLDEIGRRLGGRAIQKGAWRSTVQAVVDRTGGEAVDGVQSDERIFEGAEAESVERWAREVLLRRERAEATASAEDGS